MKQLTLLVVLACVIQNEWAIAKILTEVRPDARVISQITYPLNCTQYEDDYKILSSFPFITYLNPLSPSFLKTYGLMDGNENVCYLNVANEQFIPSTVFCLKSLQELYVRSTSFYEFELDDDSVRRLPADIERLAPSLRTLGVYNTIVTHLPEQIGKLTRLSTLQLYNTNLVALPDSIGNLSSLSSLYLNENKLTALPATIINMRSLTTLSLNNNRKLRSVQPLNGFPNLQVLYTTNSPIEHLPLNIPNLSSLQMINNNLTDLVGIRTLGNNSLTTKSFYFNINRIQLIPPQIRFVRNLYRLELNQNKLTTLPLDIFNVTTLRYLDIRNNLFSPTELQLIVAKFNATNPSLSLSR